LFDLRNTLDELIFEKQFPCLKICWIDSQLVEFSLLKVAFETQVQTLVLVVGSAVCALLWLKLRRQLLRLRSIKDKWRRHGGIWVYCVLIDLILLRLEDTWVNWDLESLALSKWLLLHPNLRRNTSAVLAQI